MLAAPEGLACKEKCTLRTQATTGQPKQSGTPCAMVLRLIRDLLGAPGFLAAVACRFVTGRLDPSVGGDRDRTISPYAGMFSSARERAEHPQRPPHPASNVRDDRDTPLSEEAGRAEKITYLRKTEVDYFACGGLTQFRKNEVICPSGRSCVAQIARK